MRTIKECFWTDEYVLDLDKDTRMLFFYLFTNSRCNIAGIYKINERQMSFETGLSKEEVQNSLKILDEGGKVVVVKGYVAIVNFIEHQAKNPKVEIGIKRVLESLPDEIKSCLVSNLDSLSHGGLHSLSKAIAPYFTLLNYNSTLPNLTQPHSTEVSVACPSGEEQKAGENPIITAFQTINPAITASKEQTKAESSIIEKYGKERAIEMAEHIISLQGKRYMPKIRTPEEMWQKIPDYQVFLTRKDEDKPITI